MKQIRPSELTLATRHFGRRPVTIVSARMQPAARFSGLFSMANMAAVIIAIVLAASLANLDLLPAALSQSPTIAATQAMPGENLRGAIPASDPVAVSATEPEATTVAAIPSHPLRTGLIFCHVIALVIGMGTALFLDAFLLSRLYARPVEKHAAELVHFGARLVSVGLAMLWLTGLGLLAFYWFAAPQALANPKLWVKIAVVALLTLNGGLLHRVILPRLDARIGRPLLAQESLARAALPLAAGVVSGTSWGFACAAGLIKEMNYVVPATPLLATYALLLGAGFAVAALGHIHMTKGLPWPQLGRRDWLPS